MTRPVTPPWRAGCATRSAPVGDVTLYELAQHRSGLPRLTLGGPLHAARALLANVTGGNPYTGWSPDGVAAAAAGRQLEGRGTDAYSNLGFALLGGVLGAADGTTYPHLLRDRLLSPLRMSSTSVVTGSADLPAERASGTSVAGAARDPWIAAGYAPAGLGVWSSAADMATLLRAVMTDSTSGAAAARPQADAGDDGRIGLGWLTTRSRGHTLTWHNGATGGFTSWIGFDRERRRGIVALSASQVPVDGLGAHLLGAGPPPADRGWSVPGPPGLVALALLVVAAAAAVGAARSSPADRLAAVDALVEPLAMLVVAWTIGPWSQVPWWLWSAAAAVAIASSARVAPVAWRRPWIAAGTSGGRLLWRCAHVALVALIVAVLVA